MLREEIITGNAFKNICDDFLDEEKPYIDITKKPKSIFLKTDWIELFKNKVLPKIDYQFKLITHNADRPAPSGNLDLLEDERLLKWYGMNCQIEHLKLQPIPIGIANEKWPHGNKDILIEVVNSNTVSDKLVYSNFDVSTNPQRRSDVVNILKEKKYIDHDTEKHNFKSYLQKLKAYKYVISPPGNSVDCHRVWESIYLGVIPIIERNIAMDYFYDLPILVVDNFSEITEDLLISSIEYINTNKFKLKSKFTFYSKLINE
jgi:hypothetical protein